MVSVMGSLPAGLGLVFAGLSFLTEHLKMLSGRRLTDRMAAWLFGDMMRYAMPAGKIQQLTDLRQVGYDRHRSTSEVW